MRMFYQNTGFINKWKKLFFSRCQVVPYGQDESAYSWTEPSLTQMGARMKSCLLSIIIHKEAQRHSIWHDTQRMRLRRDISWWNCWKTHAQVELLRIKRGSGEKKQEGHWYNFSHYFIRMEIAESAGPHLRQLHRSHIIGLKWNTAEFPSTSHFTMFSLFCNQNQDKWHTHTLWLSHVLIVRLPVRGRITLIIMVGVLTGRRWAGVTPQGWTSMGGEVTLWFHDVDTGGSPRKIIFICIIVVTSLCVLVFILTVEMTILAVMSSTEEKIFK